jgi:hypothetical protein
LFLIFFLKTILLVFVLHVFVFVSLLYFELILLQYLLVVVGGRGGGGGGGAAAVVRL